MSIQDKEWPTLSHAGNPLPIHPPVNQHSSASVTGSNGSAAVGAPMAPPILPPPSSSAYGLYHSSGAPSSSSHTAYMPPNSSPSVKPEIPSSSNSARSHTGFTAMSQPTTPRPTSTPPNSYTTPPDDAASPKHHPDKDYATKPPSVYPPPPTDANALVRRRRKESLYFQDDSPTFTPTRYKGNIYALDRTSVLDVHIHARVDRGFFMADNDWTCYRRNYFQLSGAFNLQGIGVIYDGQDLPCLVQQEGALHPISSFMFGVTARIANSEKAIPLIQHTPKRDKGPQSTPDPKPIRPGGNLSMSTVGASQSVVTFERVQFKSATANNGKRRAAQQYYLIVVDLFAQLKSGDLVVVGTVESSPLVVRGRSPGHYAEADASHQQQHQHDQQTMNYTRFVGFPSQGEYNNYEYPQGMNYPSTFMPPPPPPPGMVPPSYQQHHPPPPPPPPHHFSVHERTTSASSSSSEMYEYENGQHSRYPAPPMDHWARMRVQSNTSTASSVDHPPPPPPPQHNYEQQYSQPPYYDGRTGIAVNHHASLPPPMPSSSSGYHPPYASMQAPTYRPVPVQDSRYHYNTSPQSPLQPQQQQQQHPQQQRPDEKGGKEIQELEDEIISEEEEDDDDEKDPSYTTKRPREKSSLPRTVKSRRTTRSAVKSRH